MEHSNDSVDFLLAEVIGGYENTYKWRLGLNSKNIPFSSELFTIYVRTYSSSKTQTLKAKPANNNIKQIPLKGEHVLIFQGLLPQANVDKPDPQWYYLPAYGIQSGINENRLPGVAKLKTTTFNTGGTDEPAGETFKQKIISPLQPYEGDLLVEGRWGNSIRLGSSVENSSEYTLNANWSGESGSPIIILSNKRSNKKAKEFVVEDINKDGSSLYLTSDQELKTLKLNKTLTKSGKYNNSQLIGLADRIVLSARKNNLILDSSNRITMNADQVLIGSEQAASPLVKGDILEEILEHIISSIEKGVYGGSTYSLPFGGVDLDLARIKLGELQSKKFFIDNI